MRKMELLICDPGDRRHFALSLAGIENPDIRSSCYYRRLREYVPVVSVRRNVLKCLVRCDRLECILFIREWKNLWKQPFIGAQDTHGLDGLGDTNFPMVL